MDAHVVSARPTRTCQLYVTESGNGEQQCKCAFKRLGSLRTAGRTCRIV